MKKVSFNLILLIAFSTVCQTVSAQGILEFMNQTVYLDGHGLTNSMKMWQSLLSMATPVILIGGAVIVGYVKYRVSETNKSLRTA